MALVQLRDMLAHARHNGYAVGAFRVYNLEFLEGILGAAERLRAPLILTLTTRPDSGPGLASLTAAAEHAAAQASVPVALHLADCATLSDGTRGINRGCNSLAAIRLQDAQSSEIQLTQHLVEMAHACGVPVTAEMVMPAKMDRARQYVEDTGVDALLLSIGNLAELTRLLQGASTPLNIPLCITGDHDLDNALLSRLITHGVSQVDFDTVLVRAASTRLRHSAAQEKRFPDSLMTDLRDTIGRTVEQCLEYCGCAGRASEVLTHSTPWTPVEHVIIYNVSGIGEHAAEAMMAEGRRVLGAIPGVRRVTTGTAVKEGAAYRYCWLVTFVHPAVIDSYREHPAHVAFADNLFRPVAAERISIDYQVSADLTPNQAKIMRRRNTR